MSIVITRNSLAGDGPLAPPVHDEDGTAYPYLMAFNGDKDLAFADTPVELLGVLVPGYADLDADGRLEARIKLAASAQVAVQAVINAEAMTNGAWEALSDEDRATLMHPAHEPPEVDFWNPEVILVLDESAYEPYTNRMTPISGIADVQDPPNIVWLKPQADEWEFLVSLARAGFIGLSEATDL